MIIYKETKNIADKDLRALYVGWVSYTNKFDDLQKLLPNCRIVYSAWDGDRLVGLVRTVGDGLSIEYIQDLVVLPNYQKQGIGKALLGHVLKNSQHIRQVVLMTDGSQENDAIIKWYQKLGFKTYESLGTLGMWYIQD